MRWSRRRLLQAGAAATLAGAAGCAPRALRGHGVGLGRGARLTRFAFGACLVHSDQAQILDVIRRAEPELMVWLGDNLYTDTEDPAVMRANYQKLRDNPRFEALWRACPRLAMWDDHDYGKNNAGADYPMRQLSEAIFLDFWKAPPDDVRRTRPGIYDAVTFGRGDHRVQFVLLDGRSFRSPRAEGARGRGTVLGDAQWAWLGRVLDEPATLRFICSGVQVVNTAYPRWESWGDFPHERRRLLAMVRRRRLPGVVFLSGDMHHAELCRAPAALGYDAWDFTVGGLDQHEEHDDPAPLRVGALYNEPGGKFGWVTIDWDASGGPAVGLMVRDAGGEVVRSWTLRWSELTPS